MIITLALFATLLAISVFDCRTRRIPDALSLPLIGAGLTLSLLAVYRGEPSFLLIDSIIGATSGYLVFAAIGAVFFWMRGHEGLGLGDAKLLAAAGAWLGWQLLPAVVLIGALGGLAQATAIALMSTGRAPDHSMAFGPWLAAAFFGLWTLSP